MKYASMIRLQFFLVSGFFVSFALVGTSISAQDTDGFQPAKLLSSPKVALPKESEESGLGGKVNVLVAIDDAGNVTKVEQTSGPGSVCSSVTKSDVVAMRKSASEAASKASFSPAIRKGKSTKSSLWLTFDFPVTPGQNKPSSSATTVGGTSNGTVAKTDGIKAPRTISGGVVNGKALKLPKPEYPPAAHAVRASGAVSIQVLIDTNGEVFSAQAVYGHPLLHAASTVAACGAKFSPTTLEGSLVKVSGVITYNFVP
jgi:outer membrane biosynthesis protein TonB